MPRRRKSEPKSAEPSGKLPLHQEAWQLARLIAMLSPEAPSTNAFHEAADMAAVKRAGTQALRVLHVCDRLLRDNALIEIIRHEVNVAFARHDSDESYSKAENTIRAGRKFQKAISVINGTRVLPLDQVPLIALSGKRWNEERPALWRNFLKHRIHDRENWGIRDDGNVDEHMAASIVLEFKAFATSAHQAASLKNLHAAVKKARRSNPNNRGSRK